jgi:hypothetical protein
VLGWHLILRLRRLKLLLELSRTSRRRLRNWIENRCAWNWLWIVIRLTVWVVLLLLAIILTIYVLVILVIHFILL